MSSERSNDYLTKLVLELCKLPQENPWVEFKVNQFDPREIGEYISALANSAALENKATAYMVWGIKDEDHVVVGTSVNPRKAKVGNEELENWLLHSLEPQIDVRFLNVSVGGCPVVLLEIPRAVTRPVSFKSIEFVRVGSYTKKLMEFPEKERALWRIFEQTPFEEGVAAEHISDDEVLKLLDYPAYFDLLQAPLPENRGAILSTLASEHLIHKCEAGEWNVTNLGAMLFAKTLGDFPKLKRKTMRVIQYRGPDRTVTIKEQDVVRGYASGFEGLIGYIVGLLPSNEVIGQALRRTVPMFPELAVRELVANALIHQDFFATGTGPMVEIFDGRIEITNPGTPLVDTQRFLDTPPKSRNETLASLMRRFGICEERGSGIDKVVFQVELFQLPAPLFEAPGEFTRTVLFSHKPLTAMDKNERIRACYLHACLKYVMSDFLTNGSLRERLGVEARNKAAVSRYIKEAVDADLIKPFDEDASRRLMKYVPFGAESSLTGN